MQAIKKNSQLALAVAVALGSAAADATIWQAQLTAVSRWTWAFTGAQAGNVTSSTATWSYDDVSGLLTQTGGTFNVRFTTAPTSTMFRQSITGLVIGGGGAASATTYNCVEGNFGPSIGESLCGAYHFGANFTNESTTSWGPGTAAARTLGGDDNLLGAGSWFSSPANAVHSITDFDGFTTVSVVGTTLTMGNAVCNPAFPSLPGSANPCPTAGGFNTGFRWTLTLSAPPGAVAADDGPVAVVEGVPKVIAVGTNDTGFASPVTVTVTTPPSNGTITAISAPGPAAGMTISYTANIGAVGPDSFVYEMTDTTPATDSATVSVNVSGADAVPAAFAFTDQTAVALSSPITSNAVTITGINVPAAISVVGGEYSIGCTATFTTTPGTVADGSTVCVRHVSGAASLAVTSTTLTVGGVADTFSSTTANGVPAAFAFTDQTGVALSSPITSNAVTITGIDIPAAISVAGGEYSIGCTATFTTTAGTISNGSTVCVRHVSAAAPLTPTNTTLTVGGVADTFTSTTANLGPGSVQLVSNLTQPYDFSAGLGGAFVEASSFTTGSQAYRLDSVTLDLQVNSPGTVSLKLFSDSAGLPGALVADLGTQAVAAGEHDTVYAPAGTNVLLPNTKYWLLVEQVGGGSVQWVSTYSTIESSLVGVTIGDAMFYRPVAGTTWSPQPTATEAGQFSVSGTLTADTHADGVYDVLDNCTLRPNTNQCDSDGDGYGNRCDGDFGNPAPGNGSTNSQDNVLFRAQLGQPSIGPTFNKADLNCNGVVNSQDSTLFKQLLGSPPGPSGLHP